MMRGNVIVSISPVEAPSVRRRPSTPSWISVPRPRSDDFAPRLSQQPLAEQVGLQVMPIHRYEAGTSQPTLDVIRRLAVTLGVTADELVFGSEGRGPDQDLKRQLEERAHTP
jgi:DNA-binding XRE family transcriptional regulator